MIQRVCGRVCGTQFWRMRLVTGLRNRLGRSKQNSHISGGLKIAIDGLREYVTSYTCQRRVDRYSLQ